MNLAARVSLLPPAPHRAPDLHRAVMIGSNLAMVALLWSARHEHVALVWLLGLHALRVLVNAKAKRFDTARHISLSLRLRIGVHVFNLLVNLAIGHVAGWPLAAFMYVAWQAAIISGLRVDRLVRSAGVHVATTAAVMLYDGVPIFSIILTCGAAIAIYIAVHARGVMLEDTLRELASEHDRLAKAHEELAGAHAQLVQRDRLTSLGHLAAGVAHELNNPMTFVTNNVALLLEDLPRYSELPAEIKRDYVDDLLPATLEGIKRVNAIVSDLRRFARGDIEEVSDYDIADEIRSAVRICGHHYVDGPKLDVKLFAAPVLSGRSRQICQVFVNLLANAAQATGKGGAVSIAMTDRGNAVIIDVDDTGTGMGEETQERIFEPFFTTRDAGEGTGLGLSVVHGIVKSHGGTIEVLSLPSRGSTIRVRLPRGAELSGLDGAQKFTTTSSKLPVKASAGPSK